MRFQRSAWATLFPPLAGTWVGEYRFTEWQGEGSLPDGVVPFSMIFERRGMFGIRGTCQEDREVGIPEPSTLAGRRNHRRIRFIKSVPQLYFLTSNGKPVKFGQWYEECYGEEYPHRVPHPPVEYEGRLRQRGTVLAGEWRIRASILEFRNSEWRLDLPEAAGIWEARRASASPEAGRHR